MITAEDLVRFCNETTVVGGGDLDRQLATWGADPAEFAGFANAWCGEVANMHNVHPRVVHITFFAGFELGYRSCVEAGIANEAAPDVIPEDLDLGDQT